MTLYNFTLSGVLDVDDSTLTMGFANQIVGDPATDSHLAELGLRLQMNPGRSLEMLLVAGVLARFADTLHGPYDVRTIEAIASAQPSDG
jgi:hypothetical protein